MAFLRPHSSRPATEGKAPGEPAIPKARPWLVPGLIFGLVMALTYLVPLPSGALMPLSLGLLGIAAFSLGLLWRKERERVRILEQRFSQIEGLLAAHPALTLTLSPQGQPLSAYGAAPLSLPMDSLFHEGLIDAVHAPDRPAVQAALKRAQDGAPAQVRFTPRRALEVRLSLTLRPFETSAPQPSLIAVILDASLQHAREEALITARQEAETQNLAKSRVLANVSHELRTPLNAVIGFSDIMVQRLFGPLPDRYADYAKSISEAGHHLLDLIGDLLDFSKIEADRYELSLESLDVREVAASALALVRMAADEKGLNLTAIMPPQPLRVMADRRALKQMALNLLSNAVKFTPPGGTVTLAATALGPDLELVVSDTGLGIAPEDLLRLGRPFEQAGEFDQRAQGTGLGLSLVRALTELHRGQMTLDSTLGSGTSVTLTLPIIEAEANRTAPLAPAKIIPLNRAG